MCEPDTKPSEEAVPNPFVSRDFCTIPAEDREDPRSDLLGQQSSSAATVPASPSVRVSLLCPYPQRQSELHPLSSALRVDFSRASFGGWLLPPIASRFGFIFASSQLAVQQITMSVASRLRAGLTGQQALKFTFDISPVECVDMVTTAKKVRFAMVRSPTKIFETSAVPVENGKAKWDETLHFTATVYKSGNTLVPKEYSFKVQEPVGVRKKYKTVAKVKFNMADFCSPDPTGLAKELQVQLHPAGVLTVRIATQWQQDWEGPPSEASTYVSTGSEVVMPLTEKNIKPASEVARARTAASVDKIATERNKLAQQNKELEKQLQDKEKELTKLKDEVDKKQPSFRSSRDKFEGLTTQVGGTSTAVVADEKPSWKRVNKRLFVLPVAAFFVKLFSRPKVYKVKKGDTLYNISNRYGKEVNNLFDNNKLVEAKVTLRRDFKTPDLIYPGDLIKLR